MDRRTMTLALSDREMDALEELAKAKGLNKTAVLRQALRVYQTLHLRAERGEKLFVEDSDKVKSELLLL